MLVVAVVAASAAGSGRAAPVASIHVKPFAATGIRLADVVWTGREFLYVENTTNAIYAGDASGGPLHRFAKLPRVVEETRCVVSHGGHGFPAGEIYCHVPDNRIYRIGPDGKTVQLFATLPTAVTSDGAIAFDTVGGFGHRLLVATGRSGNGQHLGGVVYTIDARGHVRKVGGYGPSGGADEVAVAPAGFGSVAGWALLGADVGSTGGTVVAMSPAGRTRTIAHLPDGPNPITAVPAPGPPGAAAPGFYVSDTQTRNVYEIAAAELAPYAGDVLVGSELQARFWVLRPVGNGFEAVALTTDLPTGQYNLEGADYVP
jgi:hypothetical protein